MKILNRAIVQGTTDYIIKIAGECIVHKYCSIDDLKAVEKAVNLYGLRINFLPEFFAGVFKKKQFFFNFLQMKLKTDREVCTFPFWCNDFIAINL